MFPPRRYAWRMWSGSLALRMRELGFRPGVRVQMGRKVAGGARLVTIGSARYAVDAHTLRQLEVIPVAA